VIGRPLAISGIYLALAMAGAGACSKGGDREAEPPARSGRFGSLRDMVLFFRAAEEGGPFFLDRFEVTRADWAEWLAATSTRPAEVAAPPTADRDRPAARMTLAEARRFAAWRLCRVPRWDEWRFAASGRDQFQFPWGDAWFPTCANTAELGLFDSTLVGTFESGRRGDGPYDLIGNVGEWTESPPPGWFGRRLEGSPKPDWFLSHINAARSHPALRPWFLGPTPLPGVILQLPSTAPMPRLVVGWDFGARVELPISLDDPSRGWQRLATDRSDRVGLRLATSPGELLARLLADDAALSSGDEAVLRSFLSEARHREVLDAAWEARGDGAESGRGRAAQVLREVLGR